MRLMELAPAMEIRLKVNTNPGTGRVKTSVIDDESVDATSVDVKGIIAEKGEGDYEDYGFRLFNAEKDTTFNKERGVELRDDSVLVYTIKGLEPNTEYFVEAYVKNKFGTFSSDGKVKFTTKDGLPKLGSISIKGEAAYDYVDLRAQLISEGDSAVKEFGFCWGTDIKKRQEDRILRKIVQFKPFPWGMITSLKLG